MEMIRFYEYTIKVYEAKENKDQLDELILANAKAALEREKLLSIAHIVVDAVTTSYDATVEDLQAKVIALEIIKNGGYQK